MGFAAATMNKWATPEDWAVCRNLQGSVGSTYAIASRLLPGDMRRKVDAVYGFVQVPEEWIADPALGEEDVRDRLRAFRRELQDGLNGARPSHPVMRAFVDVAAESRLAMNEPFLFLDAVESDLDGARFPLYADLERYMRGRAASVALMLIDALGIQRTPVLTEGAMALAEAMQLTTVLRDVGVDLRRSRIYLPLEDLDRYGVVEEDLYNRRISAEFVELMQFEIKRARDLYEAADAAILELPRYAQRPVRLGRTLYSRILNQIERSGYDVFHKRVRTSNIERTLAAVRAVMFK